MIRLFVGLDLPKEIAEHVYSLRGGLENAKWQEKEKLHLTLYFIGNIPEDKANDVIQELRSIRFPAFNLSLKEIGYFSIGEIPHHLWVGVEQDDTLKELNKKVENTLKKAGIKNTDKYKFVPHVTLAKLNGTDINETFKYISANNLFHTKPFLVDHFSLFQSIAKENGEGKYYQIIEQFPLSLI